MDEVIILGIIGLSFGGWILAVIGGIRSNAMFYGKMAHRVIDELNKNLHCDVADRIQKVFNCTGWYGIFTERSRLEKDAIQLFLKLTIPPEKTKLYSYQNSLKVSLLLVKIGIALFLIPFCLVFIMIIYGTIFYR